MQCLGRQSQVASRSVRRAGYAPFSGARVQHVVPQAAGNGASPAPAAPKPVPKFPAPAETARTVLDLVNEGVLSTVTANGVPVGIPVSYSLTKTGDVKLNMDAQTLKLANVSGSTTCSLTVQATTMPARAVAAITLVGKVDVSDSQEHGFVLDKVLYFGGLDQVSTGA